LGPSEKKIQQPNASLQKETKGKKGGVPSGTTKKVEKSFDKGSASKREESLH